MKTSIIFVTLAGSLVLAQSQAFGEPRWTFCVASAQGGRDVWITDVFAPLWLSTPRTSYLAPQAAKASLASSAASRQKTIAAA